MNERHSDLYSKLNLARFKKIIYSLIYKGQLVSNENQYVCLVIGEACLLHGHWFNGLGCIYQNHDLSYKFSLLF